jgi:hypothetical protein
MWAGFTSPLNRRVVAMLRSLSHRRARVTEM